MGSAGVPGVHARRSFPCQPLESRILDGRTRAYTQRFLCADPQAADSVTRVSNFPTRASSVGTNRTTREARRPLRRWTRAEARRRRGAEMEREDKDSILHSAAPRLRASKSSSINSVGSVRGRPNRADLPVPVARPRADHSAAEKTVRRRAVDAVSRNGGLWRLF